MKIVDDGLRALFRSRVREAHWQTVEHLFDRGVPDSNVCVAGSEVWVEFKATRVWHVRMRPEQVGWLLTRSRHGGHCAVAVRRRFVKNAPDVDQLWLLDGIVAATLQTRGLAAWTDPLTMAPGFLGMWDGGPSRWDWDRVRNALWELGRRR